MPFTAVFTIIIKTQITLVNQYELVNIKKNQLCIPILNLMV